MNGQHATINNFSLSIPCLHLSASSDLTFDYFWEEMTEEKKNPRNAFLHYFLFLT